MDKNILLVLIVGLIFIVVWSGISIFSSKSKVELDPSVSGYILEIPASFNKDAIDLFKERLSENSDVSTNVFKEVDRSRAQ